MFEVDPNLWLQGFATPWLTALMRAVSFLGRDGVYVAAILVLAFGVRLRPMLGIMLALLLAGLCTHVVKDSVAWPRPVQVDARVLDKGAANSRWLVARGGAAGWLDAPSPAAIAAARAQPDPDFGFVSGHVAGATAFCLALLLAFAPLRRRRAAVLALAAWPMLMAVSRMVLGRHFLGDVLGGLCVGAAAALAARWLWSPAPTRAAALLAVALLACLATPWIAGLAPATVGQLLGLACLGLALQFAGSPPDGPASPGRRVARVGVAVGLYALAKSGMLALRAHYGWGDADIVHVPLAALTTLVVLGGTLLLSRRLGLYPAQRGPA